jgi:hypothetical protein
MENDHPPGQGLEPREPTVEDLVILCRELNRLGARYVVVGGFAMRAAGFVRQTIDVDLIVASDLENEALIYQALEVLPDKAVKELQPGELAKYTVIRVADEVVVDLMKAAGGIHYAEAATQTVIHELSGIPVPFASPQLLWRMKVVTHREKDLLDLSFLRRLFEARGENPPAIGPAPSL